MILYIHGFASSSKSNKVTLLKERFDDLVAFDLSPQPQKAIKQLEHFIQKHSKQTDITLIGSSLGGFYAMYLSHKYSLQAILINPATEPWSTLKKYSEQKVKNYSLDSSFYFKKTYLEELQKYKTPHLNMKKVLLLLQTADSVLNYKKALHFLPDAKTIVESGGSHQFDKIENYFDIIENFHHKKKTPPLDKSQRIHFSLTVEETKILKKWTENISKKLDKTECDSLGGGITYSFSPFELGNEIKAEYYGHTLLIRLGCENSEISPLS